MPARQRRNRAPLPRVGNQRLGDAASRRRLLNTDAGVFLADHSQAEARLWAQRLARQLGGHVATPARRARPGPETHGAGLPHFHVENPRGDRVTGHIFYGKPPSGLFFERPLLIRARCVTARAAR